MSYSFSVPEGPKPDLAERVATAWAQEAERIAANQYGEQPLDEITEQVVGAFAAVQALVANVGRPEDHVAVSISGHANPGHAPSSSYADETCSLSLRVVRPQPTETEPAPASETAPPTTNA